MPDGTSKVKWTTAQILLRSDLTECLNDDDLFGVDPRVIKNLHNDQYLALKEANALHSRSNEWQNTLKPFLEEKLEDFVSDPGLPNLTQAQLIARVIEHIESWPNNPDPPRKGKEQLREILVAAIDAPDKRPFKFKWRLSGEVQKEEIKIKERDGKTTVFFVNPRGNEFEDPPGDMRIRIGPE